jgi:hypothetical protein
VTKIDIEIGILDATGGPLIFMIAGNCQYVWASDEIPAVIDGLRLHAKGPAEPSAKGMVYSKGDRIHLADALGEPRMTYAMPRPEANRLAQGFEKTYRMVRSEAH